MKNRRLIGLLCAIAMSLTLALPAGAASLSEPLQPSDFAGETITCQVVEATAEGVTSRMVEVAIPAGTNVAEEVALVNAAALSGGEVRSLGNVTYELSSRSNVTIRNTSTNVGGGLLQNQNYSYIVAQFVIETIGGSAQLQVQVKNETHGSATDWSEVNLYQYPQRVVFTSSNVNLTQNSNVQVYARTSLGSALASVCYVAATDYQP